MAQTTSTASEAKAEDAKDEQAQPATNEPTLNVETTENPVTGATEVTATQQVPLNASSTYPGRDQDLKETDGKLNTVIDLARRAKFANSQTPAVVAEAGLTNADGQIELDDSINADARSEHERATAEDNKPSSATAAFAPEPEPSDDQKRASAEKKQQMKGA